MATFKITYSYKKAWKKEIIVEASDWVQAKAMVRHYLRMSARDEFKYYRDQQIDPRDIIEEWGEE